MTQAIIILALLTAINLHGQVTIGSDQAPNKGALLDLKEHAPDANNATATRGLGLPKVELSDLSKLIIGTAPEITGADALSHAGLIVYNTKASMCFSEGMYVWNGTQWDQLAGVGIGSYQSDVEALKTLYNANPGNTLGWNLALDPSTFAGVIWATVCGETRVIKLDVNSKNLTSSAGIEKLYMLTELNCWFNSLTTLDVSGAKSLTHLYCGENQLTSLDVSKNTALTHLYTGFNKLTSLDVSKNPALVLMECYANQLTSLDVSKNTALVTLFCHRNKLASLDVSGATALETLYCLENKLMTLDVSNNMALTSITCGDNLLTTLDVSNNTLLNYLELYNNSLTTLNISNNTALTSLNCSDNKFTTLNIFNNTALMSLNCNNNKLTALDISNNAALIAVWCSGNWLTQTEIDKFKLHPNYCTSSFMRNNLLPQYIYGTTTVNASITAPTCP
ncbi:hypothetical protein D0T66_09745 [Dysgonomonas sp. 25]|nr:hypothetical protein [Dysgonomonas sp. 25]